MQNTNNQIFNKILLKIYKLCNTHLQEKNQNATAAPDAMKVSGLANCVRAAPAPDENRDGREVNGGSVSERFVKH